MAELDINYLPAFQKRTNTLLKDSVFFDGDFIFNTIYPEIYELLIKPLSFDKPENLSELNILVKNIEAKNYDSSKVNILPLTSNFFIYSSFYLNYLYAIKKIYNTFPYSAQINNAQVVSVQFDSSINRYRINIEIDLDNVLKYNLKFTQNDVATFQNLFYSYKNYVFINDFFDISSYSETINTNNKFYIEVLSFTPNLLNIYQPPYFIKPRKIFFDIFLKNLNFFEKHILNKSIFSTFEDFINGNKISINLPFDSYNVNIIENNTILEQNLLFAEKIDEEISNIYRRKGFIDFVFEYDVDDRFKNLFNALFYQLDILRWHVKGISNAHSFNYYIYDSFRQDYLKKIFNLFGIDFRKNIPLNLENDFYLYSIIFLNNISEIIPRKGTREYVNKLVKIFNIPEDFILFNEYIYRAQKLYSDAKLILKNTDFQIGGKGVGNGLKYFEELRDHFDLIKTKDNKKIYLTEEKFDLNTKFVDLFISLKQALELDYKRWFEQTYNVPYIDYETFFYDLFLSMIDYKNIKTNNQENHTQIYVQFFIDLYNDYYNSVTSKKLHFIKLEKFLYENYEKIYNLFKIDFLPATTISQSPFSTLYDNTIFNLHKFVYRRGVDDGSMFDIDEYQIPKACISYKMKSKVNDITKTKILINKVNSKIDSTKKCKIFVSKLNTTIPNQPSNFSLKCYNKYSFKISTSQQFIINTIQSYL